MHSTSLTENSNAASGLFRLWWLRWVAVATVLGITIPADWGLGYHLPWGILLSLLSLVVLTNIGLIFIRQRAEQRVQLTIGVLLLLDLIVLTGMLYFTGGAHNPFTLVYLLHVTVAILLLPSIGGWLMVVACTLAFSLLFLSDYALSSEDGMTCCSDMTSHLQGMVLALFVTGSGIVLFVSSISRDIRRHKEAMKQMAQEIQEGQRMASLATLAASVAHELATPLGTIAVVSEELERHACNVCGEGQCKSDAKLIREEVARCRQVLLNLGEKTSGSIEEKPIEITPVLLREQLPLFLSKPLHDRLIWKVDKNPGKLYLPPHGLLSALAVLVKNAFEASAAGEQVELEWTRDAGEIQLHVRDRGTGMATDVVTQLGKPFFTTKKQGAGMGLGLFLTRTFCENHGGRLRCESHVGSGTVMRMIFPWNSPQ